MDAWNVYHKEPAFLLAAHAPVDEAGLRQRLRRAERCLVNARHMVSAVQAKLEAGEAIDLDKVLHDMDKGYCSACLDEQQRVMDTLREPWIVLGCSCGGDHMVLLIDVGWPDHDVEELLAYLVCPLHAKHTPCRSCLYGNPGNTHHIVEVGEHQVAAPTGMDRDEIATRVRAVVDELARIPAWFGNGTRDRTA
jgi:hypothetical protein